MLLFYVLITSCWYLLYVLVVCIQLVIFTCCTFQFYVLVKYSSCITYSYVLFVCSGCMY